ncbi:MAG: 2OG-Fe(II) oxygenase [Candidatus Sericytochromatia bacterium]
MRELTSTENMMKAISFDNAFTIEECNEIIKLEGNSLNEASVYIQNKVKNYNHNLYPKAIDIKPDKSNMWISQRLEKLFMKANQEVFNFDIRCMSGLRLNRYERNTSFDWHVDMSNGGEGSLRKLTMIVMLSDPNTYGGGILGWKAFNQTMSQKQGSAIVFPCYLVHNVTTVTHGTRYSLVCMAMGPHFK